MSCLLILGFVIAPIGMIFLSIIALFGGDIELGTEYLIKGVLFLIPLICFILFCRYSDKKAIENRSKLKENMKKEGIEEPECYVQLRDYGIGLADERFYIVDLETKDIKVIPINYILDFKIDLHTVQKNTKRIVALTSTYDSSIIINKITCSVILNDTTIVYESSHIGESTENIQIKKYINELERLKSLIDIKIKTITPEKSNIEMIKELKELLDINAITQEEFDSKKIEILNKL